MAKLTLNVGPEVIAQANRLAADRGTTVSALLARFIKTLANGRGETRPLGKLTRRACGVIDLRDRHHRDALVEILRDKYRL